MIGRRLQGASSAPLIEFENGSFENWASGTSPSCWIMGSTATGFGWEKNTTAAYVSNGSTSLNLYKRGTILNGTVSLEQIDFYLDATKYSKLVLDIKRAQFVTAGYDQDIYLSMGLHSDSLGDIGYAETNIWYGLSPVPTSLTLTITSAAIGKKLNDVSLWIEAEFEVSASKYNNINLTIDNLRFA